VLSDLNAELIGAFEVVRDHPGPLVEQLKALAEGYLSGDREERKAFYYEVRAQEPGSDVERTARTIFLNRTGYNGLYRVNSKGRFNVPHGRYVRPTICDEAGLRAASTALRGAVLLHADFGAVCRGAGAGDFVYLDPPYQPLSATSHFTAYTSNGFRQDDQVRLRDEFESLTRRGVAAVLSNSDHAAIRDLYEGRGYLLENVPMGRSINSVASKRTPIPELLVSNLGRPEVIRALAMVAPF
jgi:DNA adenine methylase